MPLSDHEQRLLEQMEEALYAEDPKFASQMVGTPRRSAGHKRLLLGALGAIGGLGLVIVSLLVFSDWVQILAGALGFAVMVAGGAWALTPPRRPQQIGTVSDDGTVHALKPRNRASRGRNRPGRGHGGSSGTFMQRMEQRWERRRNQY